MTELLISEITLMKYGFCVIGLERDGARFRSLRPVPPNREWRQFPYNRADRIAIDLASMPLLSPHVEDRRAAASHCKIGAVAEADLVQCLRQAEVADAVVELFGCCPQPSPLGGDTVCINPGASKRSVCGCLVGSIRFSFRFYPPNIRVALSIGSGERLDNLPVVDRDWRNFAGSIENRNRQRMEAFFNSIVLDQLMSSPIRFARIGLSRPDERGVCWPMLDSLFPLPKRAWAQ